MDTTGNNNIGGKERKMKGQERLRRVEGKRIQGIVRDKQRQANVTR